jgi:Leucine-rich repeat (LRR) protein
LNFLEALRKKYASDSEEPSKIHANEISGKIVEEVGFDKIRRQLAELQKLKIVLLDGLCLAGLKTSDAKSAIGNEELQRCTDEVVATCPEIQQLDLSRNLLESFLDVQYICKALPNLKSLSLEYVFHASCKLGANMEGRGNRFIYDPMIFNKTSTLAAFGGITSLNLDSTLLSWPDVCSRAHTLQ